MPKQKRQPGIHLHKTTKYKIKESKGTGISGKFMDHHEYYWILISKKGQEIARSKMYNRRWGAFVSIRAAAEAFRASLGLRDGHYFDHTGNEGGKVDCYII